MSSVAIDHQIIGRSRVATQYTESLKFLAYIRALLESSDEIEEVLQKVAEQTDIDLAEGVNLDVIGEIVGISRIIPQSLQLAFFGFQHNAAALVFGEEGFPELGGRFYEEGDEYIATTVLSDFEYRLLIRAKIVRNHGRGTNEDVLAGLQYMFDTSRVVTHDPGGMTIGVAIGRPLTYLQKVLVSDFDILSRPAGVRISQKVSFVAEQFLGFDGQTGAMSFGEEGQPSGGRLAEEF